MHKNFAKTAFAGKHYVSLPSCPSTNDTASAMLRQGLVYEGSVIRADTQTAGKGQRGNSWESETGVNLLFSLVLSPRFLQISEQFQLTLAVSLGLLEGLQRIVPEGLSIKWPNDLYWHNRKIAGILIENSLKGNQLEHSIAGIGLNVNQRFFDAPTASSLALITGTDHSLDDLLEQILLGIEKNYLHLRQHGPSELFTRYLQHLYRLGIEAEYSDGERFRGTITGVSPMGLLRLRRASGLFEYDLKEISYC